MRDYIFCLICVSLLSGVVKILLPEGKGCGREAGFICSLLIVCVMIRPLSDVSGLITEIKTRKDMIFESAETEDGGVSDRYYDVLMNITEEGVREALLSGLSEKFGVERECFGIGVDIDSSGGVPKIGKVYVALFGSAVLINPRDIQKYVEDELGAECSVSVH